MRVTLALLALCCPVAASAATIDLDRPGALRELERSKPSHHARVLMLVNATRSAPCDAASVKRVEVGVEARDLDCSFLLQTSLPPKRRLTFALDGAVYTTVVELKYVDAIVR